MRAKCNTETGNIYIKELTSVSSNLLIHEYIHRLSRNFICCEWKLGIVSKNGRSSFLNEAITEWLTILVVGEKESHNKYNKLVYYLKPLIYSVPNYQVIRNYFKSEESDLKKLFNCNNLLLVFEHLSYCEIHFTPNLRKTRWHYRKLFFIELFKVFIRKFKTAVFE